MAKRKRKLPSIKGEMFWNNFIESHHKGKDTRMLIARREAADYQKIMRWLSRRVMIESMGGKCQCCRYYNPKSFSAFDFHHLDPSKKKFSIAGRNPGGAGDLSKISAGNWSKIRTELKKCILLCKICHAEFHAGVRELPKKFATFNPKYTKYNPYWTTIGSFRIPKKYIIGSWDDSWRASA